jgi:L-serine deaminase
MNAENPACEPSVMPLDELTPIEPPVGVDRRAFTMRSALAGAMTVITGCSPSAPQQASALSPDLEVVKKAMNAKYKETSEGGLAVSVVLC